MTRSAIYASETAKTDLITAEAEMLETMIAQFKSGRWPDAAPWRVVPAERLKRIWTDTAQAGFVRDEKGLFSIKDRLIENYLRLGVNTAIGGHATYTYDDQLSDSLEENEIEKFVEWAINCETGWRLTDVGIDRMFPLCAALTEATEAMDVLVLCDLILNVVHQRSDLASWFVAGGQQTLSELADGVRPSDQAEANEAHA